MALVCTRCSTSNAGGARFCRACGTPLAAGSADPHESSAFDSVACDDCGHLNAPGTRYCAKCGYSLVGTVIVSRREMTLPPVASTPVSPHAARPPAAPDEDTFDPLSAPTQVMHDTGTGRFSALAAGAATPMLPAPRSGKGLWIGLGLGAFVLIAAGAWFVMRPSAPPKLETTAPVAPVPGPEVAAPAAAPPPAVPVEPARAAAPVAPPPPPPEPAATPAPAAMVEPPPAAAPAAPTAAPPAADPAAQQAARDRAAKAKAEREARAKQLAEQREQEAARVRAEQEAARKRAEQAATAKPAPSPAPAAAPAPAPVQRQTVREACAGSNLLTRGLCEQRACAPADMANDPTCVKLKEEEQKRLFR